MARKHRELIQFKSIGIGSKSTYYEKQELVGQRAGGSASRQLVDELANQVINTLSYQLTDS